MKSPFSRFNLTKINSVVVRGQNGNAVLLHIVAENELGETFEEESWCDSMLFLKLDSGDPNIERFFLDVMGANIREMETK